MSEDKLTRDDLVILMESYRNMITMHQAILDQTNKTIDKLDNIAGKQDSLFSKQGQVCSNIGNVEKAINSHEKKTIEQHGKVVNKIHLGWIGMGTIIMGLIGLIIVLIEFHHVTGVTP